MAGMCPRIFSFSMGGLYYYSSSPFDDEGDQCASTDFFATVHNAMVQVGCENGVCISPISFSGFASAGVQRGGHQRTTYRGQARRVDWQPAGDPVFRANVDVRIDDRLIEAGGNSYRLVHALWPQFGSEIRTAHVALPGGRPDTSLTLRENRATGNVELINTANNGVIAVLDALIEHDGS